jgi:glycosyltransferase involved in cell wall biosynthesis
VAARARARGLTAYPALPGRADPRPYLGRAELLLATSRYEGYGLAILEALAAGVPVLSTDVGSAREAGAIVAARDAYIARAVELVRAGPPPPAPARDPYPSFEAYVEAYAADLRATLA